MSRSDVSRFERFCLLQPHQHRSRGLRHSSRSTSTSNNGNRGYGEQLPCHRYGHGNASPAAGRCSRTMFPARRRRSPGRVMAMPEPRQGQRVSLPGLAQRIPAKRGPSFASSRRTTARAAKAALDLHYLLSFFGSEGQLEPQRLLGSAVRTLHTYSVLTRQMISDAMSSTPFGFLAASISTSNRNL